MLTDVNELDQGTLMHMLKFGVKSGANMMTFGAAGTGKTEMAYQAATALGYEVRYLNLSLLEAPDLVGLPMIDMETKQSEYATPKMLPLVAHGVKPMVLLVDEIDKAKPELQNPMLELFQFRKMNGRPINIHAIIATGNLPDENAFSRPVSHALTNRCMVYKVQSSFEPWQAWAAEAGVNPLVVGFLSRNSDYLLKPPTEGDDTAYCHPSPRAWTLAARRLDDSEGEDINFQTLIVSSHVGIAAAIKFRVWLEHYRHIEPMIRALVEKGEHPRQNDTSDRQLICCLSAVGAVMNECRKTPNTAQEKVAHEKALEKIVANVFGWVKLLSPEFIIMAVKSVLTMEVISKHKLTRFPDFMQSFMKIKQGLNQP